MKKLLVYCWGSMSESLFCEELNGQQIEYVTFSKKIKNYHSDAEFAQEMIKVIHEEGIDRVFSYDYFPLISMLCEINKIPYISWIYDCPLYTLWSRTLVSPYNYIFCFDRVLATRLQSMGAQHCEHYLLAGDVTLFERARAQVDIENMDRYTCEISFIGNLYNGEKNRFRKVDLSPYVAGYAEGLLKAQEQIYGYNFLKEALCGVPDVVTEIAEKCELELGQEYFQDELQLVADVLGMEVSAREREKVLHMLSRLYPIDFYSASKIPVSLQDGKINLKGYADYETELPLIYYNSKINLNITSKTIESGIPQRIFDILACGGFCLTNYQPEIAEYFEDGLELVMYQGMEDLEQKVKYYMEHEQERAYIAQNGRRKIEEFFALGKRIQYLLTI